MDWVILHYRPALVVESARRSNVELGIDCQQDCSCLPRLRRANCAPCATATMTG